MNRKLIFINSILTTYCRKHLLFGILISIPLSAGYSQDCSVIQYSTFCKVSNNKLTEENTILLQVNNRMGEKYTFFSLPYSENNKLNRLQVQIEDTRGNIIRKLKNSEITRVNAVSGGMLYSDDYVAHFQVKHNVYPYRVRVRYENSNKEYIGIARWIPIKDPDIPTDKAELVVEVSENFPIKYTMQNITEPEITINNGIQRYSWKTGYKNILEKEIYSPPLVSLIPRVDVLPQGFTYDQEGSFISWQAFGQYFYKLTEGLDELTFDEKIKVNRIADNYDTEIDKVRALYHYLQDNTRYINVSIDIGGLKPYPATYVCTNKYGDCKALTNYLRSILKYCGIKSYYALINANEKIQRFDPSFPNQYFNHVILYVPLANDTIWLECTNKFLPFAYIHTDIQNRYALVIDDQNSRLVIVPPMKISDCTDNRVFTVNLELNGNARMGIDVEAKGEFFESLKFFHTSFTENEKKQQINRLFGFAQYDLRDWKIIEKNRDSKSIELQSNLFVYNLAKRYGDEVILKVPGTYLPDFESPGKRKLPVQIDYPIATIDTIHFIMPEDFQIASLPNNQHAECIYGNYNLQFSANATHVTVIRELVLNAGRYPVEEYPAFFDFISKVESIEKENVFVINK